MNVTFDITSLDLGAGRKIKDLNYCLASSAALPENVTLTETPMTFTVSSRPRMRAALMMLSLFARPAGRRY